MAAILPKLKSERNYIKSCHERLTSDMADEKLYFGKCTCCLNYGYIWPMWEKQVIEEELEIYGEMLIECFDITTDKEDDQICEDCVWKLREAYLFKKQVLRCQNELKHCATGDVEAVINPKLDNENYIVEYLEEEVLDSFDTIHFDSNREESGDEIVKETLNGKESLDDKDSLDGKESDDASKFEDYEELNEDEESQSTTAGIRRRCAQRPHASTDSENKPKWPRKLPKEERYKTYKQYPAEALKSAVTAVMSKRMNQTDAANRYKVPKKTLGAKLRDVKNNKALFPSKSTLQLVTELTIVLKHLNATPFRCRANAPLCFYCHDPNPFTSAAEFRAHNTDMHTNITQKILDKAMRPLYNNEIVKLDLMNLTCNICNISLLNWLDALQHLSTIHDVILESSNKMIPFVLDDNSCVICAEGFSSFMLLHAHMNKHYSNYVCGSCGDSFVSLNRLKMHQKIHETGDYPCPVCHKIFTREVYMKKHLVKHTEELRVKCHHCDKFFKTENQRQTHISQSHREFVDSITCELCGTTFNWMRLFLRHMKRKHGTEHHCEECTKFFQSKTDLKEHYNVKHMGARVFKCFVCNKKFFSRISLSSHQREHQNINFD